MNVITKYMVLVLGFVMNIQVANAQDTIQKDVNQFKIKKLETLKADIKKQEREFLKQEVAAIDELYSKKEITKEQAASQKMEAAKKRALNIDNRIAIINNKILILNRNQKDANYKGVIIGDSLKEVFNSIDCESDVPDEKEYDKRIKSGLVLAFGFNNALFDGMDLEDSPYKFAGSRFFEIGWAWNARVFEHTNFMRLRYGLSMQINRLKPDDNKFFVQEGNKTMLANFPSNLKKSKLTMTNLVLPLHFEFGPSKKEEKETYTKYSTKHKFKIGVGGYGGLNIGTKQKLKFKEDGERVKEKQKRDFNRTKLIYGVSSYIGFGASTLYVKYDLSPIFKNQDVDQNNISIGIRFDVD
ncbi:hypothetical protein [Aquimarina agarilytica]|uniref:hypothetical protein n=1 Tax=Aquimarina agarilytica TaxID=1087449 RepID=UPI0002898230|nr:hypothetical protein [Aquimarina agarilytica]